MTWLPPGPNSFEARVLNVPKQEGPGRDLGVLEEIPLQHTGRCGRSSLCAIQRFGHLEGTPVFDVPHAVRSYVMEAI